MFVARTALLVAVAASITACGGSRAASTSGSGASQYTRQVQGYLAQMETAASNGGYNRKVAGPVYGSINRGATMSHEMTVVGGTSYVLFGACDNDCTDVDLRIHDQGGTLLMQDVLADDRPVVRFTARSSGKYRIDVVMAACTANPCRYGIQLMAR